MRGRLVPGSWPSGAPKSDMSSRVLVVPCALAEALDACARYHRHLPRVPGGKFAFRAVGRRGAVAGWLIVGRPSSRVLQDSGWLEVTRCVTLSPGQVHPQIPVYGRHAWGAASALYRAAAAWAMEQGCPILSYTLAHESGTSIAAAGWLAMGATTGGHWSRPSRVRPVRSGALAQPKRRWVSPDSVDAGLQCDWPLE
jgi:hypothetical protein